MEYRNDDVVYLGLYKIQRMMNLSENYYPTTVVKSNYLAQTLAEASLKPKLSAKASAESTAETTWSNSPDLLEKASVIRTAAPRIIKKISDNSIPAKDISKIVNSPVFISGKCITKFSFHDDFRPAGLGENFDPQQIPRAVFWLYQFSHAKNEYTWVLLSGTADQNHTDYNTNKLPETRSGSGTELIFESLHALANGRKSPNSSASEASKIYPLAESIYYIMGYNDEEYAIKNLETIFELKQIIDVSPDPHIAPYSSLMENVEAQGSHQITRIILGSPYVVQKIADNHPVEPSTKEKKITFIQKLRIFFGF